MKDKVTGRAVFEKEQALETSSVKSGHSDYIGTAAAVASGDAKVHSSTGHETKPPAADMQAFIGRQLRAVYDDIARQPVPDRFLELMKQLEGKPASG